MDVRTEADFPPAMPTPTMKRRRSLEDSEGEDEGIVIDHNYQVRQQRKYDAHQNRQRKAKQTGLTIQVHTASFVRRDSDSTDSLVSMPPTPMDSVDGDITRCSSVSPISEALDVSSSTSTSAFASPNLSPLLGKSDEQPRYRRPHMRVTRSSSKINFANDPLLDESIEKDTSTTFSAAEMELILKGLADGDGSGHNDDKQSLRLQPEDFDHIVALCTESMLEGQSTSVTEDADFYWHQTRAFAGTAILLGSDGQPPAAQAFNDLQEPNNQLGLSIPAAVSPHRLGRNEVFDSNDIVNATWSKLVLISPSETYPASVMDREFWKAIKTSKLVRYLGSMPYNQEEGCVRNLERSRPLDQSALSCYLYHPQTSKSNRPQQERSISDIKVTLSDLHLNTNATASTLESIV